MCYSILCPRRGRCELPFLSAFSISCPPVNDNIPFARKRGHCLQQPAGTVFPANTPVCRVPSCCGFCRSCDEIVKVEKIRAFCPAGLDILKKCCKNKFSTRTDRVLNQQERKGGVGGADGRSETACAAGDRNTVWRGRRAGWQRSAGRTVRTCGVQRHAAQRNGRADKAGPSGAAPHQRRARAQRQGLPLLHRQSSGYRRPPSR